MFGKHHLSCRLSSIISRRLISGVATVAEIHVYFDAVCHHLDHPACLEKGKASGDLLFFPSQVHPHKDLGHRRGFNTTLLPQTS